MAVTKGLYLTIFLISKFSLSDPSHWVMITRKSLGQHTQLFELMRETALTKDLGELTARVYSPWVIVEKTVPDETAYHAD